MAKKTLLRQHLAQDSKELISILIDRECLGFKGSNTRFLEKELILRVMPNGVELLLVYHRNQSLAGFDRHENTHAKADLGDVGVSWFLTLNQIAKILNASFEVDEQVFLGYILKTRDAYILASMTGIHILDQSGPVNWYSING